MERVVLDTNVFVSAMLSADGAPRGVLRLALERKIKPVFGNALFCEYEDVLGRASLFRKCAIGPKERADLLDALISVSDWTSIYFLWRPNLRDEGDNHLVELAVAGGARSIVTANLKDFRQAQLTWPQLTICTAGQFIERRRSM